MVMPITMRTKLKVWQKRHTWKSAHGVIDVQRSPENADAWWRRQGGESSWRAQEPWDGHVLRLDWVGVTPGYPSVRPVEPHTFNGCVLFSRDFNSVEMTF